MTRLFGARAYICNWRPFDGLESVPFANDRKRCHINSCGSRVTNPKQHGIVVHRSSGLRSRIPSGTTALAGSISSSLHPEVHRSRAASQPSPASQIAWSCGTSERKDQSRIPSGTTALAGSISSSLRPEVQRPRAELPPSPESRTVWSCGGSARMHRSRARFGTKAATGSAIRLPQREVHRSREESRPSLGFEQHGSVVHRSARISRGLFLVRRRQLAAFSACPSGKCIAHRRNRGRLSDSEQHGAVVRRSPRIDRGFLLVRRRELAAFPARSTGKCIAHGRNRGRLSDSEQHGAVVCGSSRIYRGLVLV